MTRNNKQLIAELILLLALVPALAGYYFNYKGRWILSLLCYTLSVSTLCVPVFMFFAFRIIQHCMPLILSTLASLNRTLLPVVKTISETKVVGPAISLFIRFNFFVCFMMILMTDQIIRSVLGRVAGLHTSQRYLSIINVGDSKFFKLNNEFEQLEEKEKQEIKESIGETQDTFVKPEYSLTMAHTLSVASKLAYEDVEVVRFELQKAGFDVDNTFRAIAYKNVCAYAIEKENDILLVFRGTNPLNIQNYVTNIDAGLTSINADKSMGRVHKGFWDAMGSVENTPSTSHASVHVELSDASLSQALSAACQGVVRIFSLLSTAIFKNVVDPIDASWAGYSPNVRYQSAYMQSEDWILQLIGTNADSKKKRIYITGHSLGGALATVFVAKMIQNKSRLLDNFAGLYTYGEPNIGDKNFSKSFPSDITCRIFNHTYNNDVVPRIPFWYSPPPGTLVFIDSSYKISIYPPNPNTHEPVPVRSISYIHLSGLLNKYVIKRLPSETPTRILFRILFPFFINDHFPSDYSDALLSGDVEWVVVGDEGLKAGNSEYEDSKSNDTKRKRYSLQLGNEEESY